MPNPFPGMDPYLEVPTLWPGVHQGLIANLRAELNRLLPPRYVADIGERLYVVYPGGGRGIYPDVAVFETPYPEASPPQRKIAESRTETAPGIMLPWVVLVEPEEVREIFIQIILPQEDDRVVTVIELLSPANKTAGSEGRQLYLTKQSELLHSQVHLIEIDLLHLGEHTLAVPRGLLPMRGRWDYLIDLHRGGDRGRRFEVWPLLLRERLPCLRVPLAHDDPDVIFDLQAVFDRCYDEGGYARRLDYRRDPPIQLPPEDARWVADLLRERGLRS